MQWVRFEWNGAVGFGLMHADESVEMHDGNLFEAPRATGQRVALSAVKLLAPVVPGKIIGLWNNFRQLAEKLELSIPSTPLWFLKASGSVIGPDDAIRAPHADIGRIAYEGELAIVIGQRCRNLSEVEAARAIFGYTCINDVTAMEVLNSDPSFAQWARAKSCDTFAPLGPCIATDVDLAQARVRTLVGGRERQNYPVSDMIFAPQQIVSLLSRDITLEPGDVIACGTSIGSLPMRAGTSVEITIDGIGTLRNQFEPLPQVTASADGAMA